MKRLLLIFFISLQFLNAFSQTDSVFEIKSLINKSKTARTEPGIALNHCWKYKKGDDLKWADTAYDDKSWQFINTELPLKNLPSGTFENIGWFRVHLRIDTSLLNKTLALMIHQSGASEIYLDGKLIHSFGKIFNSETKKEVRLNPQNLPFDIKFEKTTGHVLAVRFSNVEALATFNKWENILTGFTLRLGPFDETVFTTFASTKAVTGIFIFYFTFFLVVSILHFLLFFFYRKNKSNLYYSAFAFSFGLLFLCILAFQTVTSPDSLKTYTSLFAILPNLYSLSLIAMLYSIFYKKILKIYYIWLVIYITSLILDIFNLNFIVTDVLSVVIFIVEPLRIIIASIIKKREGAKLIGLGLFITLTFFTFAAILAAIGKIHFFYSFEGWGGFFVAIGIILCTLSIPLTMSIFLAREFSRTSINLETKLIEVETLSARSIEQEKEKAQILENQNLTLEKQVKERTSEITEQKKVIEEKNKDITDSINYALRIQESTLPPKELKYKLFPDAFVLFKPKDIVSGDFYWFYETDHLKYIAAADCTGHGVPGALVSVVCTNALNRSLKEFGLRKPDEILNKTRELVLETFEKSNREVKDGMDISLACLLRTPNSELQTIQWAGANNPIWYLTNGEFKEITANKQSIGKSDKPLPFTNHEFTLNKGDSFYLFSDGYADQFGGPKGKKLKYAQLKEFILMMQNKSMPDQEKFLDEKFEEWKNWTKPEGNVHKIVQIDDVLVIGVKI